MIANPVCSIIYAIAAWKFFSDRIMEEELTLINFFGEQYVNYQNKVGIGIPLIRGFRVNMWSQESCLPIYFHCFLPVVTSFSKESCKAR